jgi:hypothetical protein
MAVLRAAFPNGITGEPICSLQSLPHLDGGSGHGRQGGRANDFSRHALQSANLRRPAIFHYAS